MDCPEVMMRAWFPVPPTLSGPAPRLTLLAALLGACTGAGTDAKDDATTGASEETTDDSTEGTGDSGIPEDYVVVSGTAKDADGAGVTAEARLCRGALCLTADVQSSGAYTFPDAAPEWSSFEILPASKDLVTVFVPVELEPGVDRTIDVVVPALTVKLPIPTKAEETEIGGGLYVTMAQGDLEPPLFTDPATEFGAVRVDEAQWPPLEFEAGVTGQPLAVYYLWPFDHTAPEGIPVRFGLKGIAAGRQIKVLVGEYADSEWVDLGTFSSGVDGLTGPELPRFSTVVLLDVTP